MLLATLGVLVGGVVALVSLGDQVGPSSLVAQVCAVSLRSQAALLIIESLSCIVKIVSLIIIGSPFRQGASVSLVSPPVLTFMQSLFRLRIPAVLSILGRIPANWSAIGYDAIGRIGRFTIHPCPVWARSVQYNYDRSD